MDRWLNVWCIWHTYLETLHECRSHHWIGWIIQDFRETCVAFFNVPPGNKDAVALNPLTKEESRRVYNCDDKRLSGSTTRWFQKYVKYLKVRHRIFKIRPRVSHTGLVLWWHSTPLNVTLNETNCDWLFDMSLKRHHGRDLANESCIDSRPSAVSLKVWLRETSFWVTFALFIQYAFLKMFSDWFVIIRIRIRIRMSFIGQVCLHIRGICYSDRSSTVQQNDSDRTKNTDNKKKN